MKTSINLPDDLYRRLKSTSALKGRAIRDVAIELFTAWVAEGEPAPLHLAQGAGARQNTGAAPQQAWLKKWRALMTSVSEASDARSGLVDQLDADRR